MSRKSLSGRFGAEDYRQGARERLEESRTLLDAQQFAGAIYLGGRAVEGMLRAVVWKWDLDVHQGRKSLETGHDLRELLIRIRDLGLLERSHSDAQFSAIIERIARLWFNNMRFASSRFVQTRWWSLGEVHKNRTLKMAAGTYWNDCSTVIKRCEVLWQRL